MEIKVKVLRLIQTGCVKRIRLACFLREKHIQIEKIISTAFYAANYAGLNEPLRRERLRNMDAANYLYLRRVDD